MGLFDFLTGGAGKREAEAARRQISQMQGQVDALTGQRLDQGLGALQSGFFGAREALGQGFDQARSDLGAYFPQSLNALTGYGGQAADAIMGGLGGARDALTGYGGEAFGTLMGLGGQGLDRLESGVSRATGAFDPLSALSGTYGGRATGASNALADAYGLSGPEGIARSRAAFETSPGYNFNLEQGLDAINRARAARGELSGGNIDRDTQTYGAGLASNEWQNYLRGLSEREGRYAPLEASLAGTAATGRAGAEMTGAGGIANLLQSLGLGGANILTGMGTGIAGLETGAGKDLANIFGGLGRDVAGLYGGMGGALAGLGTGLGTGLAGTYGTEGQNIADLITKLTGQQVGFTGQTLKPIGESYGMSATSQDAAAKNFFDLIGNVAKAAVPKLF